VWYEDGKLVANASLMRSTDDIWLVANVVTDPDYRRGGICRRLMDAVMDEACRRGARQLQLQVRKGNEAAHALYEDLGFWKMHATAKLRLRAAGSATRLAEPTRGFEIEQWGGDEAVLARRLLARVGDVGAALHPGLVRKHSRRGGVRGAVDGWCKMLRPSRWAAVSDGSYRGVAVVRASARGASHRLEIVADPLWRGRVEAPLVDAALMLLARRVPREVLAEIDDREEGALTSLRRAGFQDVRTLERLALDL
jgi:hypothetical protein